MKKVLLLLGIFLLIYGCSEDDNPVTTTGLTGAAKYYPGEAVSQFVYQIDTLDSGTGRYLPYGSRTASIISGTNIGGTEYYVQRNVLQPSPTGEDAEIFFRRSETGVYFYVDTLGLQEAILEIDDSLASLIDVESDQEINIFSTPLEDGKFWDAFKLNVNIPTIGFTLSIVELKAYYDGIEFIATPATGGLAQESARIKYEVILRIPEDPANLFAPPARTYTGYGWYIEEVGLAQVQGNGVLVNALAGGVFNLDDTLSVYLETLTSFSLQ